MIAILLGKLDKYLEQSHRSLLADLCEPVNPQAILMLESTLQKKLPTSLVEYLSIHNGQKGNSIGLFQGQQSLSAEKMLKEYSIWQELADMGEFDDLEVQADSEIKNIWWHKYWLPITSDGFGNNICIDLDPNRSGYTGQIIQIWHDDSRREFLAENFESWLTQIVNNILMGKES